MANYESRYGQSQYDYDWDKNQYADRSGGYQNEDDRSFMNERDQSYDQGRFQTGYGYGRERGRYGQQASYGSSSYNRSSDYDDYNHSHQNYGSGQRSSPDAGGTRENSRSRGQDYGGGYGRGYAGGGPDYPVGNRGRSQSFQNSYGGGFEEDRNEDEENYYSSRASAFGYNDSDEEYNRGYAESDIYNYGNDDDYPRSSQYSSGDRNRMSGSNMPSGRQGNYRR